MWVQAEFSPDDFWHQTPRHFQLIMEGVRKRLENEHHQQVRGSWETAAFTGAASAGKLKPLNHYLKLPPPRQTPAEMLSALMAHQSSGAKMTIRKIER